MLHSPCSCVGGVDGRTVNIWRLKNKLMCVDPSACFLSKIQSHFSDSPLYRRMPRGDGPFKCTPRPLTTAVPLLLQSRPATDAANPEEAEHMRHKLRDGASVSTRSRVYRSRFLPVMLGSLSFLGMIVDFARSQSLAERQLADDWVKTTLQTSFGGEAKELAAFRKLQSSRAVQNDERAPTELEEEFKARLTEEMLTRLREDRDPETIFEFESDACEC